MASITISMYSSSLKPLQMIGVSLSAIASTASSSGFEPASRPNLIRPAVLEDFLHHLPLLIDLDGIDAAVAALVVVLGDGALERLVHFAQAMLQNLAEADQNRQRDAAQLQIVDQLLQIDAAVGILVRMHAEVPAGAHAESSPCPN